MTEFTMNDQEAARRIKPFQMYGTTTLSGSVEWTPEIEDIIQRHQLSVGEYLTFVCTLRGEINCSPDAIESLKKHISEGKDASAVLARMREYYIKLRSENETPNLL